MIFIKSKTIHTYLWFSNFVKNQRYFFKNDMKDFEVYKKIKEIINYSDKYVLSSFNKGEMALKIRFTDSLYQLLEHVIRANIMLEI